MRRSARYEAKNTGDSIYQERTRHFEAVAPIKRRTTTLDALFGGDGAGFGWVGGGHMGAIGGGGGGGASLAELSYEYE